jgi:hypothetical protein
VFLEQAKVMKVQEKPLLYSLQQDEERQSFVILPQSYHPEFSTL